MIESKSSRSSSEMASGCVSCSSRAAGWVIASDVPTGVDADSLWPIGLLSDSLIPRGEVIDTHFARTMFGSVPTVGDVELNEHVAVVGVADVALPGVGLDQ